MAKSINNLVKAVKNIANASSEVVSVSCELISDATGVVSSSIGAVPGVTKAVLRSPFDATAGYLMESEKISEEDAQERAYKLLDQDVVESVTQVSQATGKVLAMLMEDDDDNANTKK